jgi:protein-disulfide isomerase
MAAIALTAMSVYCLFCICLYVLSTLSFLLFISFFKGRFKLNAESVMTILQNKTFLVLILSVPLLGLLGHKIFQNEYSPKTVQKHVKASIKRWKSVTEHDFSQVEPMFKLNPGGKVKVVEFADFLCPHCSSASKTLKAFLKNHRNIEFSFYAYPLDPNCNNSFDQKYKGPGFSCTLAKGVLCAQKQGKGVRLHNDIFERQNDYKKIAVSENNEGLVKEMLKQIEGADEAAFKSCLEAPESQNALQNYVSLGTKVGVQGTPTIYVNDKKLDGGANFLILKAAYDEVN